MRLRSPSAGTRLAVPDHLAHRYLDRGWVQDGGVIPPYDPGPPVTSTAGGGPGSAGQTPPPGVLTLSGGFPAGPSGTVPTVADSTVPDGTATVVLDWVGDDPVRARQALDSENSRGGDARSTLLARLSRLAE